MGRVGDCQRMDSIYLFCCFIVPAIWILCQEGFIGPVGGRTTPSNQHICDSTAMVNWKDVFNRWSSNNVSSNKLCIIGADVGICLDRGSKAFMHERPAAKRHYLLATIWKAGRQDQNQSVLGESKPGCQSVAGLPTHFPFVSAGKRWWIVGGLANSDVLVKLIGGAFPGLWQLQLISSPLQ